jgi:hypothetical protein
MHSTDPEFSQVTMGCGISQVYAISKLLILNKEEIKQDGYNNMRHNNRENRGPQIIIFSL